MSTTLEHLTTSVRGRVWRPGDEGFDAARRPWNLAVDQEVAAVVEAADADDVAALVRYAAQAGLRVATQPTGHGATGRTSGSVLLRTGRLDAVAVDPSDRRARVGAGVRSGDLQRAAAAHGLTALPGSSPVVSVAGVVLGGGLSWFSRAFGWAADSVLSFEVVDAGGTARTVDTDSDPDLFWALRGGGGDFAVVTAIDLRLHPAPTVFGGRVLWAGEHRAAVAAAFAELTRDAPPELTLWLSLLDIPAPGPGRLAAIDLTFLGPETEGRALTAAIDRLPTPLSDGRRTMSAAELGEITAEPTDPSPGKQRAELLTRLDDAALDALVVGATAPLMLVQLRHLGGALGRPTDTPHGPLEEPYAVYSIGVPKDRAEAEAIAERQAALAVQLPASGRKPLTFLGSTEVLADALPAVSVDRLRRIKDAVDPGHVFRANHSVLDVPE